MPRYKNEAALRDPRFAEAEQAARQMLYNYFRSYHGAQAILSRETGIAAPILSRMANQNETIALEYAMRIEVASAGKLRAELLCPSGAELLQRFLLNRTETACVAA